MTNQNISSISENHRLSELRTLLKQTRELALKAKYFEGVASVLNNVEGIYSSRFTNIAFIGSPNSGKSKIINSLLGQTILRVNNISSGKEFYIQASTKENQGFILGEKSQNYPLEKLLDRNLLQESNQTEIEIKIFNEWLEENNFRLIEKLSLDTSEIETKSVINRILKGTDCIVLVIDSLMPLKKAETELLLECEKLQIPLIVTLSKLDDLFEDEQKDVIDYLNIHLKKHNKIIQNFPIDLNFSSENNRIDNLKKAIDKAVENANISLIRSKQFALTLVNALYLVRSRAQQGLEEGVKENLEQKQKNKNAQIKLRTQNLIWQQIEQDLDKKRHKIDETIRENMEKQRKDILEQLLLQIDNQNNIKNWWEKHLPVILTKTLEKFANSLSKEIDIQINSDIQWLQQEISKKFKYSLNISNQKNTVIKESLIEPQEMDLLDINTLKMISRVSTGGVMIGAIVLAPIPGISLAGSVIGGLAAEQIIQWHIKKERNKISEQLTKMIEKAELEYRCEISRKLKESYQEILSNLKNEQFRWQQHQLNNLMASKRENSQEYQVNWKSTMQKIERTINIIEKEFFIATKGE